MGNNYWSNCCLFDSCCCYAVKFCYLKRKKVKKNPNKLRSKLIYWDFLYESQKFFD